MPRLGDHVQGTTRTLEALMTQLIEGERQAFDPLFSALWPPALRYAQHLLGDAAAAEDVAQRALMRMFEEAPGYRRGTSVLAWVLSLTFWEARTERKRRSRSKSVPWDDTEVHDAAPDADERMMDAEARHELARLIEDLAPEDRALLGLADAHLLALISPSAVRKRRQRLIARLRQAFVDLAFARSEPDDQ